MRRQAVLLIVFAALLVLSLVVYFVVIAPFTAPEETPDETPETEAGEVLGVSDRFFMFGSVERKDIKTITVDNEHGGFTFEGDGKGNFVIKGYDTVNYDAELFATLLNVTSYTLAKTKVGSNVSAEKLEEYGLTEPKASWKVTTYGGDSFTVYVGDRLLTGGGYYCKLASRNSVYVLGIDVENTVLVPVETYVTPVLCAGISQDDYYLTEDFTMYDHGEKLFSLRLVDKEDMINPDALAEVIMDYPTEYHPNSSLYYQLVFDCMSLMGDSCEVLGAGEEDFKKYGLSEPAHRMTLTYKGATFDIRFSELDEEKGVYYACSNLYPNIIATCNAESFEFLEYGLIDWIDEYVFQRNIASIEEISVTTDKVKAEYSLSHGFDERGDATLAVLANGERISGDYVYNFRQYYKAFLALAIEGYVADDEYCKMNEAEMAEYIADRENAYMFFKYKTIAGEETEIGLYRYSTRHSVVTINGVGEFFVLTDLVKKIENDTERILAREPITAHDKT